MGAALGHRNARESGVVEELRLLKASGETTYTKAFHKMAARSSNLSLFKNERVLQVEKNGAQISAVLSRNTLTGKWTRWSGRIFVDSTGDGWWHPHKGVPIYTVPFRALYSADVPNLLMGSRCESITHIALGSMRLDRRHSRPSASRSRKPGATPPPASSKSACTDTRIPPRFRRRPSRTRPEEPDLNEEALLLLQRHFHSPFTKAAGVLGVHYFHLPTCKPGQNLR